MTSAEIREACEDIENDIMNGDDALTNANGDVASLLESIACSMSAMAKCELVMIQDTHLQIAEIADKETSKQGR